MQGGKAVPDNLQTTFRCMYDVQNLYIGIEMPTLGPINLEDKVTVLGLELPPPGGRPGYARFARHLRAARVACYHPHG